MKVSKQLNDLNNLILLRFNDINRWIECKIGNEHWPIYHSLDLRISENKVVHVDSNLFPGGFHHLSSHGIEQSIAAFS
jgi:glutamate--cysteine ligase